ncbi:cysteine hydrolase family protein [soil metagenome]
MPDSEQPQTKRIGLTIDPLDKRAALILVDVQEGFDDPAWGHRNNPEAEENIADLLFYWRQRGLPIFHVQHLSMEDGSPLAPGTPGCEIKGAARPLAGEPLIEKNVNSAFIGTDLEALLRTGGIDTVVITGLTTDHCVSTTARMAGNLGFDTYVVSDATATFDRAGPDGKLHAADTVHEMSLVNLHHEFATIVSTATLAGER